VIFGDGEQTRDFTYIENVVGGNLLACAAPPDQVAGKMFNVATGDRVSLNQTLRILAEQIGVSATAQYLAPRTGDILHSLADISRAQKALGYEVTVPFEEGLRRTVEWYRSQPALKAKSGSK
jgi:UDP-glucose 4-epimerase